MIPPLQIIEYLSSENKKLSQIIKPVIEKYIVSGEYNNKVEDIDKILKTIKNKYSDARLNEIDGLAVEYKDYRFVVRPSNTEPLLRLTLEAKSKSLMEIKRDEILEIIKS